MSPRASGPDGLSAQMLKATADSIAPSLTKLFNISITLGRFPEWWKTSAVVPIPKTTDLSDASKYRPISLVSVVSKLLERHFHLLISDQLHEFHPLADKNRNIKEMVDYVGF